MRVVCFVATLLGFTLFGSTLAKSGAAPEPAQPQSRVAFVSPAATERQESAVVFADQFDRAPEVGPDRYFEYGDEKGSFIWRPNEGLAGGAMRCSFAKGQVSAGSLKVVFGGNPFGKGMRQNEKLREIYWRVYVKHEPGWQGNPAKLGRATCMAANDWSQGLIAHVWGGKGDALCIDPATGITDDKKVTSGYNDFAHLRWLGLRQGGTPIFSPAESGRWVCVESHVRENTPGKADGVFQLWVDGALEASRDDLDWRGMWDEYGINAVFLENYWNEGSVKAQSRWFDEFVISTQPIGPVGAGAAPTFTRTPGEKVAAWDAQASLAPSDGADPVRAPEIIWQSRTVNNRTDLAVDAAHGTFMGSAAKNGLVPGAIYRLRLRERLAGGGWSTWSAWHAPFRATP